MSSDRYQQWVQKHQQTECPVCYGRGWTLQEDASGRPTQEVPCPYCHGQRHEGWVAEKREGQFNRWDVVRNVLIAATIVLLLFGGKLTTSDPYGQASAYLFGIQLLLWLGLIAGWILWWVHRRPKEEKAGYRPRHAPGFTDNRERYALGGFAAGLAARKVVGDMFKDKR